MTKEAVALNGPTEPLLQLSESDLVGSVKKYLQEVHQYLVELHTTQPDPMVTIRTRTDAMDRLIQELFKIASHRYHREVDKKPEHVSIMAQGGYGRRELCFHSDIDVLILFEGKQPKFLKFIHAQVFQTLWDAGLELGIAFRTVKDCRRLMETDMTIMTSLLDIRYLAGSQKLYQELEKILQKYFSKKRNREQFLKRKQSENEEREKKYGGSVYLLEPNIKEGEGGLRDYHRIYWIARVYDNIQEPHDLVTRGYLSEEEFQALWNALKFLWRIRNELHRRTQRRSDQLVVEYQESVAHELGFLNREQFLGVELFMQEYYRQAATNRRLTEKAIRHVQPYQPKLFPPAKIPLKDPHLREVEGRLTTDSQDLFVREPIYLLKIFDVSRKLGLEIDDLAKGQIEKSLYRIDDHFREDSKNQEFFKAMLADYQNIGEMLSAMNDLKVLGAFLPEFAKLHFRVQHNLYHFYTVDIHSIFAVSELGKLEQGDYADRRPTLTRIVKQLEDPELRAKLAFSILYHDVGKGEGRGHVERGAPLIRAGGARLGFSDKDVNDLEFLERSHLVMTHVAFRRDLEEQNLIIKFAKAMPNTDLLDWLYVLTFCDVRAANPEAMNDWKASLLEYLYLKTREVLQRGAFEKERVSTLVPRALEEVLRFCDSDREKEKSREFFSIMPARYLIATPPAVVKRHVELWERFEKNPIVFEVRSLERERVHEVTLLTWESSPLFSRIAGIFAAHSINILEAQLNLSTRGHALHFFKVTDSEGKMIEDDGGRWERVEKDLRDVLSGRVLVENLVAEKFKPSLFKKKVAQVAPSRVDIDNDVSAYYTVIDIYTQDRVGLLYQITSVLASLGLYVDVSKISTKVDQVADTFYVKDIFGHKITSDERIKKIREVLMKLLEEQPTPGWRPPKF